MSIPTIANVYAEFSKISYHPYPSVNNTHDTAEAILLNNNRHATCADCHNPHGAQQVTNVHASAIDSSIAERSEWDFCCGRHHVLWCPLQNQYENCLRCHGTSTGKPTTSKFGYLPVRYVSNPADPANVIAQFAATASSSHPVTHTSSSSYPQPSLLPYMSQLDGVSQARADGHTDFLHGLPQ